MPRIPVSASLVPRRLTQAETRIRELQRIGPEPWVWVGTYPTDTFTRFESPPWENGYDAMPGRRVRFRHGFDGALDIEGQFDLVTGAPVSGTVAFTLPDEYLGESLDAFIPLELDIGVWSAAVVSVDGVTGTVTLYWPIVAAPIP